jgi:hypothetical protein
MSLAPLFKISPDALTVMEKGARTDVPIFFLHPADAGAACELTEPSWTSMPDGSTMSALYPPTALKAGVFTGRAVVHCVVGAAGETQQCRLIAATPADLGFGETALAVAEKMRANLWTLSGLPAVGGGARVSFRFEATEQQKASALGNPP